MKNAVSASKQHKDNLAELAKVDPEFYKFLKKEDAGLLNFNLDDDELDEDDPEQKVHQLPGELLEMEQPDEEQDDPEAKQQVTLEMIEKWASQLQVSDSSRLSRIPR
jgi:nucleolar complex protein 2